MKFDEKGHPATLDRLIFKRLSMNDLRFLAALREAKWDIAEACAKTGFSAEYGERIYKRVVCFRQEDAKVQALAKVPTADWIAARDVESIYEGGTINDSQHKSLDRLAKITGSFKTTEVNLTQNVFNLPKYDAETEKKLKEIADREADIIQEAQVVGGQ